MASNRYNGNVVPFADNATGLNRTVFGDTNLSDDIDDNLNDDYKLGWEIVGINDSPTKQDFNALGFTQGKLISHLYQQGISEYNAAQEYYVNSLVMGSNGVVYQSLSGTEGSPNIGNNPITDDANWKLQSGTGAYVIDTVDDFGTVPNGIDTVIVKDTNRGGSFVSKTYIEIDPNTGELYEANTVTVFVKLGGGFWVRQFSGAINVKWAGAVGDAVFDNINNVYTGTDNYNVLQNLLVLAKINKWNIDFDNSKYLISQGLITPFGNYQQSESTIINGNGATLVSNLPLSGINGSSITALSTGYLDINNVLHITKGNDLHLTSNVIIQNFNFSHFGRAIYARNMIFGSGIFNIVAYNCFHGVALERCFYLAIHNMFLNGISRVVGSIGFSTKEFSNVIDNSGIKTRDFNIGIEIGGADGCKFTTISAEANNYGVVIASECSALEIDCGYLEGNIIANLDIRAVIRKGTARNVWFYGDSNNNIKMINDAGIYANIDLVNNNFVSGLTSSSPIKNIFGRITTLASDILDANIISSNFPNLVFDSESYNINTTATGYQSLVKAIKKETSGQGIVPTYFSGCHANGVNNGNRAYNQIVTIDGNSLVFDTEFDYVVTTFLSWTVAIAHSTGTIIGNFLIMADVNGLDFNSCTFKGYLSQSGVMYPSGLFTVSNNNGKIRITTSPFVDSTLYHSYLRLI